jgi:hypothetical protein
MFKAIPVAGANATDKNAKNVPTRFIKVFLLRRRCVELCIGTIVNGGQEKSVMSVAEFGAYTPLPHLHRLVKCTGLLSVTPTLAVREIPSGLRLDGDDQSLHLEPKHYIAHDPEVRHVLTHQHPLWPYLADA